MRQLRDHELSVVSFLTTNDVPYGLIEVTSTQLTKGILDATQIFREFLLEHLDHDYETQAFGGEKRYIEATLVVEDGTEVDSLARMYRAEGRGDRRLWFPGLKKISEHDHIIAAIWAEQHLWVIDTSTFSVESVSSSGSTFATVLRRFVKDKTDVVTELLDLMRGVAAKGFMPAPVIGSTAVGRLLESELGIPMNSKAEPDYKGIELKSGRKSTNRSSLFAKTPIWSESTFKSSRELLKTFGYDRSGRMKLYCQIEGHKTNSLGFRLVVDSHDALHVANEKTGEKSVVKWDLEPLRQILAKKHDETFWVKAETKRVNGWEHLRFTDIVHTRKPIVAQFAPLIAEGIISLDFTIRIDKDGKPTDSGYLFKILPKNLDRLFPPSVRYDLGASHLESAARKLLL